MRNLKIRLVTAVLAVALILSLPLPAKAAETNTNAALEKTQAYIEENVTNPSVGSIGGEWTVTALARNHRLSEFTRKVYLQNLLGTLHDTNGVLTRRKYTEYARVTLALSSMGTDAANVGGFDMVTPLYEYDNVISQGINGPIWALIALDSRNYPAEEGLRERYIDTILSMELPGGGFGLVDEPDDMTPMAIQALAPYKEDAKVQAAIDRSIAVLDAAQTADGGFSKEGGSESISQVVIAFSIYDPSLLTSEQFTKNGNTMLDALMNYQHSDGSFDHILGEGSSLMATEQAALALTAYDRALKGETSIWDMTDVEAREDLPEIDLSGKNDYPGFEGELVVKGTKEEGGKKQPAKANGASQAKATHAAKPAVKPAGKTVQAVRTDGVIKKEELETIKGQEVNLEASLKWEDGEVYTVTIHGKDVKEAKDCNLQAKKSSKYEIDILKLSVSPWMFSFEKEEAFPADVLFETKVDLADGEYLLMKYNAKERRAELMQKVEVKDGMTKFILSEGGDYFISNKVKSSSLNDEVEDDFATPEEAAVFSEPAEEKEGSPMVFVVIGGILVLVAVIFVIVRKQGKKNAK